MGTGEGTKLPNGFLCILPPPFTALSPPWTSGLPPSPTPQPLAVTPWRATSMPACNQSLRRTGLGTDPRTRRLLDRAAVLARPTSLQEAAARPSRPPPPPPPREGPMDLLFLFSSQQGLAGQHLAWGPLTQSSNGRSMTDQAGPVLGHGACVPGGQGPLFWRLAVSGGRSRGYSSQSASTRWATQLPRSLAPACLQESFDGAVVTFPSSSLPSVCVPVHLPTCPLAQWLGGDGSGDTSAFTHADHCPLVTPLSAHPLIQRVSEQFSYWSWH